MNQPNENLKSIKEYDKKMVEKIFFSSVKEKTKSGYLISDEKALIKKILSWHSKRCIEIVKLALAEA